MFNYRGYLPVDLGNWLVKHQIQNVGCFVSGGFVERGKSNLMFTPNPDFKGDVTPFQHGIMRDYMAEYNLENGRIAYASNYPSRLNAIYLFESEDQANQYKEMYKYHVEGRILKKVHSFGPCVYSTHDLSWIDFLRENCMIDKESIDHISKAYWGGDKVEDCRLLSMGKPWTKSPILEILFLGRIDFYDKKLGG